MIAPRVAMVLAAGLGRRMRQFTDKLPKPLVEIAGRSLLDRTLDRLAANGIETAVINLHYMAGTIESHLADRDRPHIVLVREGELLDTGGGVKNALARLGEEPFFIVNSDIIWFDGPVNVFRRLIAAWDEAEMDALLLLHPTVRAVGYDGSGDYFATQTGGLRRRAGGVAPFLFSGMQLAHPRLLAGTPDGAFPMTTAFDLAEARGKLRGIIHDGEWFHVGSPEGVAEAEARLASHAGTRK